MEASATPDGEVSWPWAAAVTVDAGDWLPKRAALRAAVQLRALHPAQFTPCPLHRPWRSVRARHRRNSVH